MCVIIGITHVKDRKWEMSEMAEISTREKLILQGMEEIREHGMQGFSLRRVASKCGVSCAAPYKHFADKQDLFVAMVDHIIEKWDDRVKENFRLRNTVEETIAAYARDYVAFLCEYPQFKSILMIRDTAVDSPIALHAAGISVPLARLFVMLKRKRGLDRDRIREIIFLVRSLMYGSTVILSVDESEYESRLDLLESSVLAALMKF